MAILLSVFFLLRYGFTFFLSSSFSIWFVQQKAFEHSTIERCEIISYLAAHFDSPSYNLQHVSCCIRTASNSMHVKSISSSESLRHALCIIYRQSFEQQ